MSDLELSPATVQWYKERLKEAMYDMRNMENTNLYVQVSCIGQIDFQGVLLRSAHIEKFAS